MRLGVGSWHLAFGIKILPFGLLPSTIAAADSECHHIFAVPEEKCEKKEERREKKGEERRKEKREERRREKKGERREETKLTTTGPPSLSSLIQTSPQSWTRPIENFVAQ